MQLVGWFIWIYDDARTYKPQTYKICFLSEKFLILKRTERDIVINEHYVTKKSTRYSSQILMKPEFSRQIFEKSWNIKFHSNSSSRETTEFF
jgi:hypothetical protein